LARLLGLGAKPTQKTRRVSQSASAEERRLIEKYKPFTLTSAVRQYGLLNAINYIDRIGLPGDIVECGVWRGGNCMMAKERCHGRSIKRDIYLFDTFLRHDRAMRHRRSSTHRRLGDRPFAR